MEIILYLLIMIITVALGMGAQFAIKSSFKRWSDVPVANGMSGAEAARVMLDSNGLNHVPIHVHDGGEMSDYYDPRSHSLHLSRQSYEGRSVADVAIACHEAGHALQYERKYAFAGLRQLIAPAVSLASMGWVFVFMLGILVNSFNLVMIGIYLFGAVVAFQLITLPVEFDASRRAVRAIETTFALPSDQNAGVRKMLTAAAFTYIASALASVLQLLYYLSVYRGRN